MHKMSNNLLNKFKGSLFGMAVCDAYGTTFEFQPRSSININEFNRDDYMGSGVFKLMPGVFTDDTSLGLIMAESLLDYYTTDSELKSTDLEAKKRVKELFGNETEMVKRLNSSNTCLRGRDILDKYRRWYNDGHFSANGECFDIGLTTRKYLAQNLQKSQPFCTDDEKNDKVTGNGALMRLTTVPLYFYGLYLKNVKEKKISESDERHGIMLHRIIEESGYSSMTTHPSQITIDCNRYFSALIIGALQNATKEQLLQPLFVPSYLPKDYWQRFPLKEEILKIVRDCSYKVKKEKDIHNSGSSLGALEAALWGFYNYDNMMDGLFNIVKLGDDSDTVAAIYGQIAGAFYGIDAIPEKFVRKCIFSSLLHVMAKELLAGTDEENSFVYKSLMKVFYELEYRYTKINSRISQFQYKSTDEYKQAIEKFENRIGELIGKIIKENPGKEDDIGEFRIAAESLLKDFQRVADFAHLTTVKK